MLNYTYFFVIVVILLSFNLVYGQYLGDPNRLPSPPYYQCIFNSPEGIQIDKLIPSLVVTDLQDCAKFVKNFRSLSNSLDVSLPNSNWQDLDYTSKHLLITEVEISPPNGKHITNSEPWIEVYNPTNNTFFMPLEVSVSDTETKFTFNSTLFPSHQFKILNFSNTSHTMHDRSNDLNGHSVTFLLLPYPDSPLVLQKIVNKTQISTTPILSDPMSTSETWQIENNGKWIFAENTTLAATKTDSTRSFISMDKPKHLSPLKQFKSGVKINEIQCSSGLHLIIKSSNNSPACVKPEITQKLIERNWTKPT